MTKVVLWVCIGTFAVFAIIGIGTISSWSVKDKEYKKNQEGKCTISERAIHVFRCCRLEDRQCVSRCRDQSCSQRGRELTQGTCCDSTCCLFRACVPCSRCTGSGEHRRCRQDPCCHTICSHFGDEQFYNTCGNCTDILVVYSRPSISDPNTIVVGLSKIFQCGLNDVGCVADNLHKFHLNSTHPCWYKDDASSTFSKPSTTYEDLLTVGIVFFSLAAAVLCCIMCGWCAVCHEARRMKRPYNVGKGTPGGEETMDYPTL